MGDYKVSWNFNKFLIEPAARDGGNAPELGEKGRYWMARLLAQLGGLLERRDRVAEAHELLDCLPSCRHAGFAGLPFFEH